jgi:hypothetical protein
MTEAEKNKALVAAIEADSLTPEELHEASKHKRVYVRQAVARSPYLLLKTFNRLASESNSKVRDLIMANPVTPHDFPSVGQRENSDASRRSIWFLSQESMDTEKVLPFCAQSPMAHIREFVAKNRHTSHAILALLANDDDWEVRQAVAENTSTSIATLFLLSKDEDPDVRNSVASNSSTPFLALTLLIDDDYDFTTYCARLSMSGRDQVADIRAQFASSGIDIDNPEDLPTEILLALL